MEFLGRFQIGGFIFSILTLTRTYFKHNKMGGCCSAMFNAEPETPKVITPDPPIDQPQLFVSARLGYWGWSHDFGVWNQDRPEKSEDQQETMWLWFRKRDAGNCMRVNLENFVRTNPEKPKQGQVLYYSMQQKNPQVQSFNRIAGASRENFLGFMNNNNNNDDHYYQNYPGHGHQLPQGSHVVSRVTMITKWQSYSTTRVHDGDVGRGEALFGQSCALLDVLAIGTAVTTYVETVEQKEDKDAEGRVIGHHTVKHMDKDTTVLVDSVQYRVTVNNLLWSQWIVPGDSVSSANANSITVTTPFFSTVLDGGWTSRTKYRIQTNMGIDPALALLLSHIVTTEYSITDIKNDLHLNIPARPPQAFTNPSMNMSFQLAQTLGNFGGR